MFAFEFFKPFPADNMVNKRRMIEIGEKGLAVSHHLTMKCEKGMHSNTYIRHSTRKKGFGYAETF